MKTYNYIARDSRGAKAENVKQAASKNDVLTWLREQGLTAVSVSEMSTNTAGKQRKLSAKKGRSGRISSGDLSALCWQLSTMVEGGIPITAALKVVADDLTNLRFQEILQQILDKMLRGQSFSTCLSEYPKVFNHLSCAIMLAGETGGNLADALQRLAMYFEGRDKLRRKVLAAVAYPIFVFVFIVLIVVFVMAFIVPRFTTIFEQMQGEMPGFTKGFMGFYEFLRDNVMFIIGSVILTIITVVFSNKTKKGHRLFSKIALLVPLLGGLFKQAFVVAFCKTMATLLASGVSVLEVFDILLNMTNNDIIKDSIVQTREQIVGGANISNAMGASGFFPNMLVKMIQVGEESGSLSKVLDRTSDYYERKVDATITTLMNLLEPIMIVIVGAIVLIVVLALYLPIFSMS